MIKRLLKALKYLLVLVLVAFIIVNIAIVFTGKFYIYKGFAIEKELLVLVGECSLKYSS
jgi:hypothetical protein